MYKKHKDLIEKYKNKFFKNENIIGMMVVGSVARNTAYKISDLDIIVLQKMESKKTFRRYNDDNLLVEIHYLTYQQLKDRLISGKKSYYAIIEGLIIFSKTTDLKKIKKYSINKLKKYKYTKKERIKLKLYLEVVKIKVEAATLKKDKIQASFILTVSFWKIIEGIFCVNNKPVPPNGSTLFYLKKMNKKPNIDKISTFLEETIDKKIFMGLYLVDWVLKFIK